MSKDNSTTVVELRVNETEEDANGSRAAQNQRSLHLDRALRKKFRVKKLL